MLRKTKSKADMLYSGALMLMVFFLLWFIAAMIAFKMLTHSDNQAKFATIKQRAMNAFAKLRGSNPAISAKRVE
jgi:hypothetical protein